MGGREGERAGAASFLIDCQTKRTPDYNRTDSFLWPNHLGRSSFKSIIHMGDVPCSVEKGEAGMVGLRGQAASLMVSMALFAFAFFT